MSDADSFIEEVSEEVRRDRLFSLFRKYGWIGVIAVLLIVGGASYNEWRKAEAQSQAQALGDQVIAALENDDNADRAAQLAQIKAQGVPAAVVSLLAAGESVVADTPELAINRLRDVAENTELPDLYRQVAQYKLILVEGSARPLDERRATLDALAIPGQPLRPLALEQLAILEVEAGNTDEAVELLQSILRSTDATAGLRQRASQLIIALGATPDAS